MRFGLSAVTSLCLFVIGCASAQTPAPTTTQAGPAPRHTVQQIQEGDEQRNFIVDLPSTYTGLQPVPVVVVLHGYTATAAMAEVYTHMRAAGERAGFIAIFADGLNKGWNAYTLDLSGAHPNDVKFVSDILDWAEKTYKVDTDREYVAGHSNGAFMANLLGAKLSNRLAAIASVAGSVGLAGRTIPAPAAPVSVILIHGKMDSMVAYDKNSKALVKSTGAQESAAWWAKEDGCSTPPSVVTSPDGNVETELYSGGKNGTEVELVSIKNGGHSWPGGVSLDKDGKLVVETATGVHAATLIWEFFAAHPKHR